MVHTDAERHERHVTGCIHQAVIQGSVIWDPASRRGTALFGFNLLHAARGLLQTNAIVLALLVG